MQVCSRLAAFRSFENTRWKYLSCGWPNRLRTVRVRLLGCLLVGHETRRERSPCQRRYQRHSSRARMNAAGSYSRSWAGFTRRTLPNDRHIIASSFINAMFRSRCVFSIIFAASAVRMLADWYTRPSVTSPTRRSASP